MHYFWLNKGPWSEIDEHAAFIPGVPSRKLEGANFYPEDMTSGCTVEACNFRDDKSKFEALNTAILGVSMDPIEMHKEFTEKDHLNFPLLVDTTGTICRAYGVPTSEGRYPKRWTFLIDKNGKIAKIYQQVHAREHSAELLKDIATLPQ